jgi:elongator complex protein 1
MSVGEMYPETTTAAVEVQGEGDGEDVLRPTGGDATLLESMMEVGKKREAPVVKGFERLSLLG